MPPWLASLLAVAAALGSTGGPTGASVPRTMRVDYVHAGRAGDEQFALERVSLEGAWSGPDDRTIDDTNLGKYRFDVVALTANRLLYSRGFASIYGEWELTEEATTVSRAFHESVRFPEPTARVRLTVSKRDAQNVFRQVWSVDIDPASPSVNRAEPTASVRVWAVQNSGAPSEKVDLLLVGDGYTTAEMEKWHGDAARLTEALFAVSPFREQRHRFNVWALDVASEDSGITYPSKGIYRRTAVGAAHDALGAERYILTFENARLREVAAAAPYEFLHVVANDAAYGGGGIHNFLAATAADHPLAPYIFVHELGHHFAGLADEYYTSPVTYVPARGRPEPWEPNVTADPQGTKWADLLSPGVRLPTPWPKAVFEARERAAQARRAEGRAADEPPQPEARVLDDRAFTTRLLTTGAHAGVVGAFEGALYEATGYYRPQANCLMFSRGDVGFCAVCRRAIERVIELYAS